jgi:hypothetical protein
MAITQIRGDTQLQNNTLTNDSLTSRTDDLTIQSVSNGDIALDPNGTGVILATKDVNVDEDIRLVNDKKVILGNSDLTFIKRNDSEDAIELQSDTGYTGIFAGQGNTVVFYNDTAGAAGFNFTYTNGNAAQCYLNFFDDFTLRGFGVDLLTIKGDGSSIDLNNKKITTLATPTADQDAANKLYVDGVSAGLDPKQSSRLATTVASGNITGYVTGTLTIDPTTNTNYFPTEDSGMKVDGVFLAPGDRVLVKNQTDAKQNGIYTVTDIGLLNEVPGPASVNAVLERSDDMDGTPSNEVSGGNFTFVEAGTLNVGTGWVVVFDGDITLDTDNVNWTQFSQSAAFVFTDTNSIDFTTTGTTVTADVIPDTVTANTLAVTITSSGVGTKYDANSFSESSETLTLASGVAGAGLALTTGVLSVNVDGSTLEIPVDTLQVKDAGITFAKTFQVVREVPSGAINGSNTAFDTANNFVSGSEHVYLNGILQNSGGNDYTVTDGNTITFTAAPLTGSVLLISYWRA